MHTLFLVPYTPNLIRTRPYNLIRSLRRRGHDITLLTLTGSAADITDLDSLRAEGVTVIAEPLTRARSLANSLRAFMTPNPLQAAYCWQPALARRLDECLTSSHGRRPVDIVHVEHLRGARYALHAKSTLAAAGLATPVVWDSVDCISHLFRQAAAHSAGRAGRWMARLELPRTERYEGWLAWQFDAVLATSPVDQHALAELAAAYQAGAPPIRILPNGVDLDYFQPEPAIQRDPATLVLSGKMSYHANVTMAVYLVREIMPRVWVQRPDTRVVIVGKDPAPEVRALAENPAVTITGTVPDVRAYLQQATIAVAPITYGAGIQNKVLEAMACAAPVVASRQAVSALEVVEGRDVLTGDGAGELAEAVLVLLAHPDRRAAVGIAGRAYAVAHHDWAAIAARLEALYQELLATTGNRDGPRDVAGERGRHASVFAEPAS